jgi:hypothetical protein
LCGYAPSIPYTFAISGSTNNLIYDPTTQLFALRVSPDNSGTATVAFSLSPVPSLRIAPRSDGQFQISWPAAAQGYVLETATNLVSPVTWSPSAGAVTSTNDQNLVIITNNRPTEFYRLRQ